jgi:hypothetical protein
MKRLLPAAGSVGWRAVTPKSLPSAGLFPAGLRCKASPKFRVRLRFAPAPAKKSSLFADSL